MNQTELQNTLQGIFPNAITFSQEPSDMLVVEVDAKTLLPLVEVLNSDYGFAFLVDICGIHYPEREKELGAIYQLLNMQNNTRIRIKVFVSKNNPNIPTLCEIYSGANWMERETFDFYGIHFVDHPNLKRILNVEYLDYFPLRKEYPLEDQTREDKDNSFFGR